MKEISVIHKHRNKKALIAADYISNQLISKYNCSVNVSELSKQQYYSRKIAESELINSDAMIILGGDGTFLHASSLMNTKVVPMLGINMGSLGFLTSFSFSEVDEHLQNLFNDQFILSNRLRLDVSVERNGECLFSAVAANDVVINYGRLARLMEIHCFIDDEFVSTYKSDGLILATPMGSTAYALAAGGPILLPGMHAYAIVPICSHQLTQRPIVISSDSKIEIKIERQGYITIDGQRGFSMKSSDVLKIRRSALSLKVFQPLNYSFFDVLRLKLSLGAREAHHD